MSSSNQNPPEGVVPLDKAVADKLFAAPPADDGTDPGVDEFDAAQMSGSWFTPEKDANLGGPRVRYAPGAPPPVIATVRHAPEPDTASVPPASPPRPPQPTSPWLLAAGVALVVAVGVFLAAQLLGRGTP